MRIMTNYIQIIAVSMSFNLHFPEYMRSAFSGASEVGNTTNVLLSFDCLLLDSFLLDFFNNIIYLKITWMALMPIVLIGAIAMFLYFYYGERKESFKRVLWISIITILFVLHPTLTSYSLRIFKWDYIGNGHKRVEIDIKTEWWSIGHLKWVFLLGIPLTIFYVIGYPVVILIILYKKRYKVSNYS